MVHISERAILICFGFGDPGAEPAKARSEYFPSALSIFASADRPCHDVLAPRSWLQHVLRQQKELL